MERRNMRRAKYFTPEREFGFASESFALVGEALAEQEVKPEPRQDTATIDLFAVNQTDKINS